MNLNEIVVEKISMFSDHRGVLMPIEFKDIPFVPARSFIITQYGSFDAEKRVRGKKASKTTQHYFYCIIGEVSVSLFDGTGKQTFHLRPGEGIFIDKMIWMSYLNKTELGHPNILHVLASKPYNVDDYITDLDEFKKLSAAI